VAIPTWRPTLPTDRERKLNRGDQIEPDPARLAQWYGADRPIIDCASGCVCSGCGGRDVDFVVTELI
jgi:hypothetical protein